MIDAIFLVLAVYYYLLTYSYTGSPGLALSFIDGDIIKQIITALTIAYVLISLSRKKNTTSVFKIKTGLLITIIALTTILSTINLIHLRRQDQPWNFIHDHSIQVEEGLKYLVTGVNPYTRGYQNTPLSKWHSWSTNPAIQHFISLPSTLYLALPTFLTWQSLFGWYDHRITSLIFLGIASFSAYALMKTKEYKLLAILSLNLNPFFTPHLITGVGDIVFLGSLLLSLLLLKKQKVMWSLFTLALAVTTKHSAWFIIPFYFLYIYQQGYLQKHTIKKILVFGFTVALAIIPFILWDAHSFWQDIYSYPAGKISTSYPIKGYGISPVLINQGIIPGPHSYFPFWFLQLVIALPIMFWLLKLQSIKPALSQIMLHYGILLWVFWTLSRFFTYTYVGVVTVILVLGGLLLLDEKHANKNGPGRQKLGV